MLKLAFFSPFPLSGIRRGGGDLASKYILLAPPKI